MISLWVLLLSMRFAALVRMMLMPTFAVLVLMIVAVGQWLASAITLCLAAEWRLWVLALFPAGDSFASRSVAATAFSTAAISWRTHSAISRATTTATATATTPSAASATRLSGTISAVSTGGTITATALTFYASVARATGQRERRVSETVACVIRTNAFSWLAGVSGSYVATAVAFTVSVAIAVPIEVTTIAVAATFGAAAVWSVTVRASALGTIAVSAVEIIAIPIAPVGVSVAVTTTTIPTWLALATNALCLCTTGPITARSAIPVAMSATTTAAIRPLASFTPITTATITRATVTASAISTAASAAVTSIAITATAAITSTIGMTVATTRVSATAIATPVASRRARRRRLGDDGLRNHYRLRRRRGLLWEQSLQSAPETAIRRHVSSNRRSHWRFGLSGSYRRRM
jgi:hypothetical protein